MIDIDIIKNDAKEYAEQHFTPEWMTNEKNEYWYYNASEWFKEKHKDPSKKYPYPSSLEFDEEVHKLWEQKWNEYFGKEDDYFDFLNVIKDIKEVQKTISEVEAHGHFDVTSISDNLTAIVSDLNKHIAKFREERAKNEK